VNAPDDKRGAFRGKGGLGRGLGALFPAGSAASAPDADATAEPAQQRAAPTTVDIDLIAPNPRQPRTSMEPEALAALAESVRQHGLIQPLLVSRRATPGGGTAYVLVAGERRLHAARAAGLARVPVVVREVTPQQQLELALVENIQRADLNPLEEAAAFQQLQREFGLTQEALAERTGRSRAAVANTLRLLALPEPIKQSLAAGAISEGHARALLGLPDAPQTALWQQIVEKGLSVRQTEALARALREAAPATHTAKPTQHRADPDALALVERLERALGTGVQINRGRAGGKLVIQFYSDDELDALVTLLAGNEPSG
jgi:ParB family transcriptional regulator, chromosome partitioning protein